LRSVTLMLFLAGLCSYAPPASALSTIQQETPPAAEQPSTAPIDEMDPGDGSDVPETTLPDDSGENNGAGRPSSDFVRPDIGANEPSPEILHDLSKLPEPVRRMREMIIEACKSGDPEKLRPLIGTGDTATQLSLGRLEEDPIKFLHELSGDDGGQEILAILLEVMQMDYVHLNPGTPSELYVWPYFFAVPLDSLTAPQQVQLFTLVTAGDYQDMKTFGAYNFYRAGITPEGRWLFFVAGD
jgi:hypothetical protein